MLLVAPVRKEIRREMTEEEKNLFGIGKLNISRSTIPAVTHVDYSARVQTVNKEDHPLYYNMIKSFDEKHGCSVIINRAIRLTEVAPRCSMCGHGRLPTNVYRI